MARRLRGRPPHPDVLTPAEWQVLDWLRHGVNRHEIARRRRTSLDAVKYHIANIAAKLGVDRTQDLRIWPGYPATSALSDRKENGMTATSSRTEALALGPLGQVALHVRDIGRAEAFYGQTLGLPHHFTFGDLAFFDMAGTRLYLRQVAEDAWVRGSILYFLVPEIHAAWEELGHRGVTRTGAPHNIYTDPATGTEEWMAFFEDSEGNTLAIMSRVQPAEAPSQS